MQIIILYSLYNDGYSDFHLTQHAIQNIIGTDTRGTSAKRVLA